MRHVTATRSVFLSLVAAALALASPQAPAAAADPLVGKAGGVELTSGDLRRLIDALPEQARRTAATNPSALGQAVRGELLRRLVLDEARAKGFEKDPAVTAELDRLREEIVVRQWLARAAALPAGFPSDEDVQRAYQGLRERAGAGSDYRLSQIFLAAQDGAAPDKLQAALRKATELQGKLAGGDFAALARTYSEHAESAAKGGDLGWQAEGRLLPEVRAALAAMQPGETVGPVKTAQGLHFIRLAEKKPTVVPPLAEVREALVAALRQEKANELQQRYLGELAQKSPPSINELELAKLVPAPR